MRALITGGQGFVGGWLAAHLRSEGDEVAIVDVETDVADPAAIGPAIATHEPEVIYHLAALAHVGESWAEPSRVLRVNVLGTAEVLAAARALPNPPLVLVVSSAEVYGAVSADQLPVHEEAPVTPVTPYAASKAAAEQVALQAWRGFGQPVTVVRPFNHIGPRQAPNFAVSALARRIVEARRVGAHELAVGALTTRRDFTDVRDVVRAYRLLGAGSGIGGTFNVCSGHDVAIGDVAARLLELAGADLELRTDPALLRPVDVPVLRGSSDHLAEVTGWKPEIPLDDTLRDVLDYWEAEGPS
ncbi:MAG TPA: GDP-mannose 4,6-dehydratase [Acidimicrobiales bacterium]